MIVLGRDAWSDEEIFNALCGRYGTREIQFRYDIVRDGSRVRSISAGGSISLNRFADIQRTAMFTVYEELDWLLDEIKPYMLLRMDDAISTAAVVALTCAERDALEHTCEQRDVVDMTCAELDAGIFGSITRAKRYAEFPLGVFVLSTPTRRSMDALNTWDIEAYDRTVILLEDSLTEPLFFAAGTPYITAVQSVLASAGIMSVLVSDYTEAVLRTDREFEIGMKKMRVINALLDEINFNGIYCDAEGRFVLSAYTEPSASATDLTYAADDLSLIARDTSSEMDYYNVPNVFIAICSNPDLETDYVSVWENNNPVSRLSTVRRGRRIVSEVYQPDAITSQESLDAYIRRIAFNANQVYEKISFETALMPIHGRANVLALIHPDINGAYVESSWEMPLSTAGQMRHTARRLVAI